MNESLAPLNSWLTEPLSPEVRQSLDRLRAADDVQQVAVMPDVHLSRDVCVGTVVATRELIYPAIVGSDIGCGMAALAVNGSSELLSSEQRAATLLDRLTTAAPAIKQARRAALSESLASRTLSDPRLARMAQRDGCVQLGTLGRGNHFLEFQTDDDERLWVLLHSGSRGMGQSITEHHLRRVELRSRGLAAFASDSAAGAEYLHDVEWGRSYAAENRLAMLRSVEEILRREFGIGVEWESLIHSDHNHVQRERHGEEELWVHRKGAQSARVGELGIVPGSMATESYHVAGRGCAASLTSCSHGAGRRLSRAAARRQIPLRQLESDLRDVWFDPRRLDSLLDEAPAAYKNVQEVLRAQRELVKVVRRLTPVLNYKG